MGRQVCRVAVCRFPEALLYPKPFAGTFFCAARDRSGSKLATIGARWGCGSWMTDLRLTFAVFPKHCYIQIDTRQSFLGGGGDYHFVSKVGVGVKMYCSTPFGFVCDRRLLFSLIPVTSKLVHDGPFYSGRVAIISSRGVKMFQNRES